MKLKVNLTLTKHEVELICEALDNLHLSLKGYADTHILPISARESINKRLTEVGKLWDMIEEKADS